MRPLFLERLWVASPFRRTQRLALNDDERPRLIADLGEKHFLMLRNHGLLTVGETVADAFLYMYIFERARSIQVAAQAGGNPLIPISGAIMGNAEA